MKEIYLAGGCFWGTEHYFQLIDGVIQTEVGYANGNTIEPTYEEVCRKNSGHAETVKIIYNEKIISLDFLLRMFFDIIDPTSLNRQGQDVGMQYRSGIFYIHDTDSKIIENAVNELQKKYTVKIVIDVQKLIHFYSAESYHQKYLIKNPGGYCHISHAKFENAKTAFDSATKFYLKNKMELKQSLTPLQYDVTQNSGTEKPFDNEYYNNFEEGIYVDITSGEPLFISTDKFESNCGWPSFSKPISTDMIKNIKDETHSMTRTEVRSRTANSHLGHVFNDGKPELGGLRYCINSASLKFISKNEMTNSEYEKYLHLLNK